MASNDILVTLRADMKDLQNSFKELQDSLSNTEKNTKGLSDVLGKIGKVVGITAIGKQVVDLGKQVVETGKSFEYEMSKVSAISGATGKDFEDLTELAKELGATTLFSASDASQGMQYLAMAGWKTQDIMAGLPAILNLSIASGADLARVSDIASDAMTGFGMQADEAGHFADVLAYASSNANVNVELLGESFKYVAPLAQTTNQSMEMVTSAISKLGDAGIKGGEAGTALRAILNRLASGNTETVKAFEELNLEIYDGEGKMKSLSTIIGEVTGATADMTDQQKNTLFSMIAGTEALSAWNVLMGVGEEGLNSFTAELENADGSAQSMADTMGDNLKGSIDNLESALEGLQIVLYDKIKEPVRAVVDGLIVFVEWLTSLDSWCNENKNTLMALGGAFLILSAGLVGFKFGSIIGGLTSLAKTVATATKVVWGLNTAFWANPATWIAMGLMALVLAGILLWKNWDTVWAKCKEVWGGIKEYLSQVWENIKAGCSAIWGAIKEYIGGVWNSIKETASTIWNGIVTVFEVVWNVIKSIIMLYLNFLKLQITIVFTVIKTIVTTIWNGIVAVFEWVWSKIGTIVMTALGVIRAIITFVFQAILILIAMIWTGISAVILTVWEGIKAVVSAGVNFVKDIIDKVFTAVRDFIVPIWEAISEFFYKVWESIKEKVTNAVLAINKFINDKFYAVRDFTIDIWNKVANYFSEVWDKIKSTISTALDKIKQYISDKFNAVKNFISSVWDGIKSATSTAWELIKTYVINPVITIKDKVMSMFSSLKDGVIGIWDGIKSGIVGVINGIIRAINGMIGAMNKFSFDVPDWVPGMGGKSFGFNIPKIPELSWHAKGGIFTKPTVIGNHGFGEAGKEAILPLHKLPKLIGMDKQQELIDKILAGEAGATGGNTTINIERFENNREQDVAQLAKELEYYRQRYNFAKGVR